MRRSIKLTLLLLIGSVFIVFGSIGGCSDNGGGGGGQPTDPPPTQPPPTQPPPPPGVDLGAAPIDPANAPVDCDDPIWDEADEIAVPTSTVDSGMLYGDGQLNMSGTLGGENDFNRGDDPNLKLAALYTTGGSDIYIRARWDDVIFNLDRRRALYNGPSDPDKADDPLGWTSQLNDDKIGFAFEIDVGTESEFGTFDQVGCAAACHFVDGALDMRPEFGKVDIWHWKTSRSEPVAYVNDQFADPVGGRQTDAGVGMEARNKAGDSNRGGPMMIWDGTDQIIPFGLRTGEMLDSAFILLDGHLLDVEAEGRDADAGEALYLANGCVGCHGVDGEGVGGFPPLDTIKFGRLSDAELDTLIVAVVHPGSAAYLALSDDEQADVRLRIYGFWGIPGYYLMKPEGSAADVTTVSDLDYSEAGIDALTNITDSQAPDFNTRLNRYKFDQEGYCVVLMRDLDTGHDDDTPFDILETYVFGVALMDNDGKNHVGNTRLELGFLP